MIKLFRPILIVVSITFTNASQAVEGLGVFTSDNPESNALHSFVVVPDNYEIPLGITSKSEKKILKKQSPFKIEILDTISDRQRIQWQVTIPFNHFGRIRVKSSYSGKKVVGDISTSWTSHKLDVGVADRHILLFEPRRQKHKSPVYKKGKPTSAGGAPNGGGSEEIGVAGRNPRLGYLVEARILDSGGEIIKIYKTTLQMDNKDLIRQEYINHFKIPRSTAGEAGKLPVPTRAEILSVPPRPPGYEGTKLTESEYELIIEDGAVDLAQQILAAYDQLKQAYQQPGKELKDLNGERLDIPDSRLWLSSGWRNPERNEWYSDALNGAHQMGAALDIMPNEIPRQREAAIVYWVLWEAVQTLPLQDRLFAQLEALTVPMRASSFKIDIEPKNGIPDAFDTADHLHVNWLNE